MKDWFRFAGAIVATLLSFFSSKLANAQSKGFTPSPAPPRIVQACYNAGEYARVSTLNTPLNVRRSPDGVVIGSIPRGWEVIVQDVAGNWAYVTSHWGVDGLFASAPDFRSGWVSAEYLTYIGAYCDKPSMGGRSLCDNPIQLKSFKSLQISESQTAQPCETSQDWTQLGDRISQTLSDSH